MSKPRKGSRAEAVQTVAAIHRGGLGALKAAEELLRSDSNLHVRCSTARLRLYREAAEKAGVSLTKWVLSACDAALELGRRK